MSKGRGVALTVCVGVLIGLLIGYALGFTHGSSPPTADNASPPPDAFDYPFGIFVGLVLATVGRMVGRPLLRVHRRRSQT